MPKVKKKKTIKKRKRIIKKVSDGIVYIQTTFNNTIITLTDKEGNTLAWSSSGCVGFKGSRKSTPFAAQIAVKDAIKKVTPYGLKNVHVLVKGPGAGRETAIRTLQACGLRVESIKDITPSPHNGCRLPKRRRV